VHVILKEFYVDQQHNYFINYSKQYTDFPFVVTLKKDGDTYIPDRFFNTNELGRNVGNGDFKPVLFNDLSQSLSIPNGKMGAR